MILATVVLLIGYCLCLELNVQFIMPKLLSPLWTNYNIKLFIKNLELVYSKLLLLIHAICFGLRKFKLTLDGNLLGH
jgi:hypothetical protein